MAEVRKTRIDLSDDERAVSIDCLNDCLANTLFAVLASKFAHWNVKGAGFLPAHRFFDEVYKFYSDSADTIAERITALGGTAEGLLYDVSGTSKITYNASASSNVKDHQVAMADMLGQVGNFYRSGIDTVKSEDGFGDYATQDVFIELCREADKLLYFLEAELRAA